VIHEFTDRAARAVDRYGNFLNILRSQADTVFRRGPTDENLRQEALSVAQEAARSFLSIEQAQINDDTADVARSAYSAAMSDLALSNNDFAGLDRFADFIFSASYYVSRILAAQAERDIIAMAQHIQGTALRIDLYVRSGRHSQSSAAAQVMIEDNQMPAFRFVDRMGRKYKASKHIRDLYRLHLLNVYNEVYMDIVAEYGHDTVRVAHPEPSYKWQGQELLIVSRLDRDLPLYYDVKDEIFHPSSEATLTIKLS
jgi:hypothetical protein